MRGVETARRKPTAGRRKASGQGARLRAVYAQLYVADVILLRIRDRAGLSIVDVSRSVWASRLEACPHGVMLDQGELISTV